MKRQFAGIISVQESCEPHRIARDMLLDKRKRAIDLVIQRWAKGAEPWCKVLFDFWTAMIGAQKKAAFGVNLCMPDDGTPRASDHVLRLSGSPSMHLYVHVSTVSPPLWGLQYRQIELLCERGQPTWAVVLLDGSHDHGYVLPEDTYFEIESQFSARQTADGCIVDVTHPPPKTRFDSFAQFLGLVAVAGKAER